MVHVLQHIRFRGGAHVRKADLHRASLVCKSWRISAQRLLLGHWKVSRASGLRQLLRFAQSTKSVPIRCLHLVFGFPSGPTSLTVAIGDLDSQYLPALQRFARDIKQLFISQRMFSRDEKLLEFVKSATHLRSLGLHFPIRNAGMRADLPRYLIQLHDLLEQYLTTQTDLKYLNLSHATLSEGFMKQDSVRAPYGFRLRQLLLVGCIIADDDLAAVLASQQYSLRSLGLSRIAGPTLAGFIESVNLVSCNLEELFLNVLPYNQPREPDAPPTDVRAFVDMPICLQHGGYLPTISLMSASGPILAQCQQLRTLALRDPLVKTGDLDALVCVQSLHVFLTSKDGMPLDAAALVARQQLPALQELIISPHDVLWSSEHYGQTHAYIDSSFSETLWGASFPVEYRDLQDYEATRFTLPTGRIMESENEIATIWL